MRHHRYRASRCPATPSRTLLLHGLHAPGSRFLQALRCDLHRSGFPTTNLVFQVRRPPPVCLPCLKKFECGCAPHGSLALLSGANDSDTWAPCMVPFSMRLLKSTRAPCSSAIFLTTAKPKPVPLALVVT